MSEIVGPAPESQLSPELLQELLDTYMSETQAFIDAKRAAAVHLANVRELSGEIVKMGIQFPVEIDFSDPNVEGTVKRAGKTIARNPETFVATHIEGTGLHGIIFGNVNSGEKYYVFGPYNLISEPPTDGAETTESLAL